GEIDAVGLRDVPLARNPPGIVQEHAQVAALALELRCEQVLGAGAVARPEGNEDVERVALAQRPTTQRLQQGGREAERDLVTVRLSAAFGRRCLAARRLPLRGHSCSPRCGSATIPARASPSRHARCARLTAAIRRTSSPSLLAIVARLGSLASDRRRLGDYALHGLRK